MDDQDDCAAIAAAIAAAAVTFARRFQRHHFKLELFRQRTSDLSSNPIPSA